MGENFCGFCSFLANRKSFPLDHLLCTVHCKIFPMNSVLCTTAKDFPLESFAIYGIHKGKSMHSVISFAYLPKSLAWQNFDMIND